MPVPPAAPDDHIVNGGGGKGLMIEMAMRHKRDLARNGPLFRHSLELCEPELSRRKKKAKAPFEECAVRL